MINARELRIGNLVHDSDRENPYYYTVEKIQSKEYSESAEESQDEIIGRIEGSKDGFYDIIPSPIPLTEEWLLKLGWIWNESLKHYTINWGKNGVHFIRKAPEYNAFAFQLGQAHYKVIETVHQLQNLYFALTGEELEFTEL